jgi:aminomethyltransferase
MRRTPLYDRHVAAGAKMVEFAGFEMPVQYTGLIEEHVRVRESVGLFDVSHMGEIRVRGPKALAAVNHLVSNDVGVLVDGQAQYAVMCNEQGGIVDDVVVYKLSAEDVIICVNAANRDKDLAWVLAHQAFPAEATITDEGDHWVQLAVQGRNAAAVLRGLTDVDVDAIGTYHFAAGTVAGIAGCLVARTGYTGEDGFEVFAPAASGEALWDAIVAAGQPHGLLPIGLGARDTLRLEVRYPLYGHELDDETSPLQAGLAWVVKLDKPDGFVGSDAVRARRGKAKRLLCGIRVDGKRIPRDGMSVLKDGEVVGVVTSGTRSPSTDAGIALAYVDRPFNEPGTALVIDVRGRPAEGVVIKGPFYERPY